MSPLSIAFIAWLVITGMAVSAAIAAGVWKIKRRGDCPAPDDPDARPTRLEMLVPVAGSFPDQEIILSTLLKQNYPTYEVVFIVESEADPANTVVDRLCRCHKHARKVISGVTWACAQKNHNLIAGVRALRPDTEIIVTCDGSNRADPDWLARFSKPLQSSEVQVVTTFRAFHATPETIGGVSQAMYAAFLRLLGVMRPTPWGGATAIRRDIFDRLNIVAAWSRTVVDDLVLGNVLEKAGVKVHMDPCNLLTSPLTNQSFKGFLHYLDRQILFPKFTNPGLWTTTVAGVASLGFSLISALLAGVSVTFGIGFAPASVGWVSVGFLCWMFANLMLLRKINEWTVSVNDWLLAFLPCVCGATFLCLRSLLVDHIDWHGRRYRAGREGIVLSISRLTDDRDDSLTVPSINGLRDVLRRHVYSSGQIDFVSAMRLYPLVAATVPQSRYCPTGERAAGLLRDLLPRLTMNRIVPL